MSGEEKNSCGSSSRGPGKCYNWSSWISRANEMKTSRPCQRRRRWFWVVLSHCFALGGFVASHASSA